MKNRTISSFHNHSCFSFQDGVATPEEIIAAAKSKGLKSIAITEHGHTHSHARFFLEGKQRGVRALLGTEAYVIHDLAEWKLMKDKLALEKKKDAEDVDFDLDKVAQDKANRKVLYRKGHLVLVAQNRKGLANIYNLTFKAHKFGYYQKPRMDKQMLADHCEGLIASSACMGGVISQKLWGMQRGEIEWDEVVQEASEFAAIFKDRFFLELQSNEAEGQKYINEQLVKLHKELGIPLIVTMDAHYVNPDDWKAQEILHLLLTHRNGKQGLTYNNLPDTYRFDVKSLYVKSADELWDSFLRLNPEVPESLLEQAFDNTLLADSLIENFEPDTSMRLPSLPYEDTFKELLISSREGLKRRGLDNNDKYIERLGYELNVIKQKGLANYFLVVRNIVESAKKEMLIGPGRGSAAGSLICYLTGITNIDPIEHKLMFERFINLDRIETPDIDLDFQDVDRVKDILRRDFGENNVACISAYGTNQIKGLLKDVSRVYGIDHNEVNKVNAQIEREMRAIVAEGETKSAIVIKLDDIYRLSPSFNSFISSHKEIESSVRSLFGREHHVSRHASGVVIGDDLPSETSIFVRDGVVQASFTDGIVNKSASNMGLVKFDILGLATLEVISYACKLIASRTSRTYEDVLYEIDPKVMNFNDLEIMKTVFWNGNMTGIFSVTSQGMMKLFQQVKPTSFEDISAVCALYRPGPLGSGMDQMYARRKNGLENVTYDHPILEDILKDTYGCLVYQEQMLEIGRRMGKMDWKDTNRLRKLFLKKDKSKQDDYIKKEEDELRQKLINGVVENGLTNTKGQELWEMLSKFGGYGFNACLTGDTVLIRSSANENCKQEVSINELWENQESRTKTGGMTPIAKKMKYAGVQVLQLDPDGRIRPGKLKRVISNGIKDVWEIRTESGKSIKATLNHRFFTTDGYKRVDELHIGSDVVMIGKESYEKLGPSQHASGKTYNNEGWPEGSDNPAWIDGRTGFFNNAIDIVRERASGICEFCDEKQDIVSKHSLEFAHISPLDLFDGDYAKYHSAGNILHLCNSCHKKFDYAKCERKPRWSKGRPSVVDIISEIVYIGKENTFDIEMETEGHNFIANDFVSHNSHSKAYAMVTMQTAYLRTKYPMEFFAALLTRGQAADLQTYVNDIQKQGFQILPVDVNLSGVDHKIEGTAIRLALSSIKGIGASAVEKIVAHQPYKSFLEFLFESGTSKTIVDALIKVGAFLNIEKTNTTTLALRHDHFRSDKKLSLKKNREIVEPTLLSIKEVEDDQISLIQWERELLGFNLRGTPFSINDRYNKIDRLVYAGLCTEGWQDFADDESKEVIVAPFLIKEKKETAQRNGKTMAWLRLTDRNGVEFEAPSFGNIWEHVKGSVRTGDVYIMIVHKRKDDPSSFIVGKPGWAQTAKTAAQAFIPIDQIKI